MNESASILADTFIHAEHAKNTHHAYSSTGRQTKKGGRWRVSDDAILSTKMINKNKNNTIIKIVKLFVPDVDIAS